MLDQSSSPISAAAAPSELLDRTALDAINDRKKQIVDLELALASKKAEVDVLKKKHIENNRVTWKEASMHCLEVDQNNNFYFLKSAMSVSNCISKKYAVELSRANKNLVATTLSLLFQNGKIGRYQHNGASLYGLTKFFEDDLITLKPEYQEHVHLIRDVI